MKKLLGFLLIVFFTIFVSNCGNECCKANQKCEHKKVKSCDADCKKTCCTDSTLKTSCANDCTKPCCADSTLKTSCASDCTKPCCADSTLKTSCASDCTNLCCADKH